jgi:hypothetical protein
MPGSEFKGDYTTATGKSGLPTGSIINVARGKERSLVDLSLRFNSCKGNETSDAKARLKDWYGDSLLEIIALDRG